MVIEPRGHGRAHPKANRRRARRPADIADMLLGDIVGAEVVGDDIGLHGQSLQRAHVTDRPAIQRKGDIGQNFARQVAHLSFSTRMDAGRLTLRFNPLSPCDGEAPNGRQSRSRLRCSAYRRPSGAAGFRRAVDQTGCA
jgi:hypothetical protein